MMAAPAPPSSASLADADTSDDEDEGLEAIAWAMATAGEDALSPPPFTDDSGFDMAPSGGADADAPASEAERSADADGVEVAAEDGAVEDGYLELEERCERVKRGRK